MTQHKNVSEQTASVIDAEVRRFVEEAEATARKILTDNIDQLEAIAKGLLEYETLSREDVDSLIRGEGIVRNGGGGLDRPKEPPRPRSSVPTSGPKEQPGGFGPGPEPQPGQ